MKKIYLIIISILIFIPFQVKAYGISNYYIDATVLDNGDISVKELFVLNGSYNGFERIIDFKNPYAIKFENKLSSFNGSDIYNGDSITLVKIAAIDVDDDINYNTLFASTDDFSEVNSAFNGEYGVFTRSITTYGEKYRIYNPYSNKGFYTEYIIHNMAVVHNDIAEVGFNIFSDDLNESIENLEMYIHIPGNTTELRAWGHGPLFGETSNIDKETILLTINLLDANTAVDVRFVFDKSVVKNSSKFSNVDGLESILSVETTKAEEANLIRDEAIKQINSINKTNKILNLLEIVWLFLIVFVLYKIYKKYDKEYKSDFSGEYYRDFPSDLEPEIVGYLLNMKIGNNEVSASILNLINKKVISFEEIDKKDYKFMYDSSKLDLITSSEKDLINWIFNGETEITLSKLKNLSKKNYSTFLSGYTKWKKNAISLAKEHHFYEETNGKKLFPLLLCLIGSCFKFIRPETENFYFIDYLCLIVSIISIIYLASISKRTKEANEEYAKWKALKKFLIDFGRFGEKELPEIQLWEKYLVYAVVFGCADKLAKTMDLKLKELSQNQNLENLYFDYSRIFAITRISNIVSSSINNSINSANQARNAKSTRSSSRGHGGGFSGGGGSFGGGGGGGRF